MTQKKFKVTQKTTKDFIKPPIQCRKCKGFVHIEKTCDKEYKSGKCGENHLEYTCRKDKENAKCKMQNVLIVNKITRSIEAVKWTKKPKT